MPATPPPSPKSNPLIDALCQRLYAAQVTEYQFQLDAELIRAFRKAASDLVLHLHADGTVLNVLGSPALHLFHDTAQVLQRNLDELLPPEAAQAIRAAVDRTLREQKPISCECTLLVDAETKYVEARVIALRPQQARVIMRDITAHHHAVHQLRDLSRRLLNAQEDERRRLSNDLHDEIGQELTAIHLAVSRAQAGATGESYTALQTAETLLQALTQQVRRLAQDLHPTPLDELGLAAAVRGLLGRFAQQTALHVEWRLPEGPQRFAPEVELAAYRIVQEALTNVARHAQAEHVTVAVDQQDHRVLIQIADDGRGFDVEATLREGTYGLHSMRERASLLGGSLRLESAPGQGTRLSAEIPIEPVIIRGPHP